MWMRHEHQDVFVGLRAVFGGPPAAAGPAVGPRRSRRIRSATSSTMLSRTASATTGTGVGPRTARAVAGSADVRRRPARDRWSAAPRAAPPVTLCGLQGDQVQPTGQPHRHREVIGRGILVERFRNHLRCWASDSGTRSGRSAGISAGRSASGPACAIRAASADTVLHSNSSRTGTRAPTAALRRAATWVAISELPPGEEVVIEADPPAAQDVGEHPGDEFLDRGGGRPELAVSNSGSGSAFRSSLPEVLSGNAASTTNADGIMYAGNARAERPATTLVDRLPRAGGHIAHQLIAEAPSAPQDHGLARRSSESRQRGLDLAELDPQTTQLHLEIGATRYSSSPPRIQPHQVTGAIHPIAAYRRGWRRTGPRSDRAGRHNRGPADHPPGTARRPHPPEPAAAANPERRHRD